MPYEAVIEADAPDARTIAAVRAGCKSLAPGLSRCHFPACERRCSQVPRMIRAALAAADAHAAAQAREEAKHRQDASEWMNRWNMGLCDL